jgi:hypothetical protein
MIPLLELTGSKGAFFTGLNRKPSDQSLRGDPQAILSFSSHG